MVATFQPLDFWTLFVVYVFGSFWLAVIGIAFIIFVIMAALGRVSMYSTIWYLLLFLTAMTLGYGFILFQVIIIGFIVTGVIYSFLGWVGRAR